MRHGPHLAATPAAIRLLTPGVHQPPPMATLITPPRSTPALLASFLATPARAVPLPAIATRADVRRPPATIANQTTTIRSQVRCSRAWTASAKPAMMDAPGAPAPGSEAGDGVCQDVTVPRAFSGPPILYDPTVKQARSPRATMMLTLLGRRVRSPESRGSQPPPTRLGILRQTCDQLPNGRPEGPADCIVATSETLLY